MARPAGPRARVDRIESVDLARGVASLIMIQGHAYDGWVAAEHKASVAYQATRVLGTLPLPAFMVLAGASLALRLRAAEARGEHPDTLRPAIVRRGLTIVAWGYASSLVYALLDGADGLGTLLRADVLHVIGLSIVTLGLCALPRDGRDLVRRSVGRAALAALLVTVACPWVTRLSLELDGPGRYLVALLSEVPGVTRMPLVPLMAWTALGMLAGWLVAGPRPRARLLAIALVGLLLAVTGHAASGATLEALGGSLARSHPAVIPNVVEYLGRGVLVLGLGGLVGLSLPAGARRRLVTLGRGSLVAYVVHIPFCYGSLGGPLSGSTDVLGATPLVLLLMGLSYASVVTLPPLWERLSTLAAARPSPAPGE